MPLRLPASTATAAVLGLCLLLSGTTAAASSVPAKSRVTTAQSAVVDPVVDPVVEEAAVLAGMSENAASLGDPQQMGAEVSYGSGGRAIEDCQFSAEDEDTFLAVCDGEVPSDSSRMTRLVAEIRTAAQAEPVGPPPLVRRGTRDVAEAPLAPAKDGSTLAAASILPYPGRCGTRITATPSPDRHSVCHTELRTFSRISLLRGVVGQAYATSQRFVSMAPQAAGGTVAQTLTITPFSLWGDITRSSVSAEMTCTGGCRVTRQTFGSQRIALNRPMSGRADFTPTVAAGGIDDISTSWVLRQSSLWGSSPVFTLRGFALRCDKYRDVNRVVNPGCIVPGFTPTMRFDATAVPAARHVWRSQQSGLPGAAGRPLHYVPDVTNNKVACARVPSPRPGGGQCDEYPFNSSWEGAKSMKAAGGTPRTFGGCLLEQVDGITLDAEGSVGWSVCILSADDNNDGGKIMRSFYQRDRVLQRLAGTPGDPFMVDASVGRTGQSPTAPVTSPQVPGTDPTPEPEGPDLVEEPVNCDPTKGEIWGEEHGCVQILSFPTVSVGRP